MWSQVNVPPNTTSAFHADGNKYHSVDYWQLILYQHDSTLGEKEACNSLNREMFNAQGLTDHAYPIGGVYEQYSRLVPNKSQLNQFMPHDAQEDQAEFTVYLARNATQGSITLGDHQ